MMLVDQLAKHRDEDVDRVGGLAGGVAQYPAVGRPDRRVKRAIHLRAAVDQIEKGLGGHCLRGASDKFCTISPRMMRTWRVAAIAAVAAAFMGSGCRPARSLFCQDGYEEENYLFLYATATSFVERSA